VEFGEAQFDVEAAPLSQVSELKGTRRMHEVTLENLKEESNYFWRIVSDTESGKVIISETFSFKTAVKDSSALFFALVGDTQKNNDTPRAWDTIARKVWQERPHFIVHAGDLVDWGPKKTDWTQHFFPGGKDLMARVPMYTVLGNHEGDADLYYQYMANPQPEYRYTFRYGNVEFFMIDSNRDLSEDSEQYNWLEQALAQSEATWKVAIHHHPPYSSESNDHGDTYYEASRMGTHARDLTPLYDKYGVDFCLFGHTHVYERTWPLKDHRINQRQGTIYINSGGAGGFLETFAPTRNWFTAEIQETHHFCTFAIFDQTLIFKAIDDQGRVFDSFQMHKGRDKDELSITEPPAPIIESGNYVFHENTQIRIYQGIAGLNTYYTLDGTEPDQQSTRYQDPIRLSETAMVKARSFTPDGKASRVVSKSYQQSEPLPAQKVKTTGQGVRFQLFSEDWREKEDAYFDSSTPEMEGILPLLSLDGINPMGEYWGVSLDTYLKVA
ncbi:MAG: metallophosphoesterase, partial [Bacteroidota bacterium]